MKFVRLCISIISTVAVPATIKAQTDPIPSSMQILIEDTDDEGKSCGLRKESLNAAIASAMRYNRISQSTEIFYPAVYVVTTTIADGGYCFTSWELNINRPHFQKLEDGRYIPGTFQYCQKGGIMTGRNQGARMSDTLKQAFDQCLSSIEAIDLGA